MAVFQGFTSAGTKIYISAGQPATNDASGYGALTFTEIKEVTDIGSIGAEFGLVTHMPVADPTTYKLKTNSNTGQLALKGARVTTDAGQTLLRTAAASRASHSIKITLANGVNLFVQGLVMGYTTNIAGVANITAFESKVELSGDLVEV